VRTLLVTGHRGFVGRALRQVVDADPKLAHWRLATLPESFDIRSPELPRHVAAFQPDAVLHLAGLTSVADSFADPELFFDVNFHGTWNLLQALGDAGFSGRFLFVSSGDCYGSVAADALPIAETHPLRPRSPYAVSKVAAEALCFQWSQTERLDAVLARSFNHMGRGQDERFATASFARQIARIRAGLAPPRIDTGDLGVTRDMTDVRDVVRAYFALIDSGRTGEVYNVGSGRETRLADVVEGLLAAAKIEAQVVTDPKRMREGEQRRARADVRKIRRDTGWSASIPLSETLADMLDDWQERMHRE
jgi:GDP-4-dehydro-6-deoxy-D-mannose reductase